MHFLAMKAHKDIKLSINRVLI